MTTLPDTMTAIEIANPGGPEVLRPVTRPMPAPGAGEVLIAVAAAGLNRPDVMQRKGQYPPPPGASDIPGLEIAGMVVRIGLGVHQLKIGDEVCALVTGGGYASHCVAPEPQCLPVPKGFTMVEAAALPETFFTVWHNLFERGKLNPGEVHPHSWRIERHRHGGDPACPCLQRAARSSPPPAAATNVTPARNWARRAASTTSTRISSRSSRRRPPIAASMSCSTWSAAITSRGI